MPPGVTQERFDHVKETIQRHGSSNPKKKPLISGTPIPEEDVHFEYDDEAVEKYQMISNEFDYEEIRQTSSFGIK